LERFLELNKEHRLLSDLIHRVATGHSKVNEALKNCTIGARLCGDLHKHSRLHRRAQQRANAARIVVTMCAVAGLGTLYKVDIYGVLINEGSQPCAPILLSKGIKEWC